MGAMSAMGAMRAFLSIHPEQGSKRMRRLICASFCEVGIGVFREKRLYFRLILASQLLNRGKRISAVFLVRSGVLKSYHFGGNRAMHAKLNFIILIFRSYLAKLTEAMISGDSVKTWSEFAINND